jgi:hypothetical protein
VGDSVSAVLADVLVVDDAVTAEGSVTLGAAVTVENV